MEVSIDKTQLESLQKELADTKLLVKDLTESIRELSRNVANLAITAGKVL